MAKKPDIESVLGMLPQPQQPTITEHAPSAVDAVTVSFQGTPLVGYSGGAINPLTAGRTVLYDAGHPDGPYVAICVFAVSPTCGNLVYWTHDGHQHVIERSQYGDGKRCWSWLPRA